VTNHWTCQHFSQANPEGPGQDDLPALLRRVAESIEELGAINVMDLTVANEITADGDWWSATVYFNPAKDS
jgi:hypothetical protein